MKDITLSKIEFSCIYVMYKYQISFWFVLPLNVFTFTITTANYLRRYINKYKAT